MLGSIWLLQYLRTTRDSSDLIVCSKSADFSSVDSKLIVCTAAAAHLAEQTQELFIQLFQRCPWKEQVCLMCSSAHQKMNAQSNYIYGQYMCCCFFWKKSWHLTCFWMNTFNRESHLEPGNCVWIRYCHCVIHCLMRTKQKMIQQHFFNLWKFHALGLDATQTTFSKIKNPNCYNIIFSHVSYVCYRFICSVL